MKRLQAGYRESSNFSAAIYVMPEVMVSAPRPVTTIGGAAAVTVQVDSLALPPAATVEEVFRELHLPENMPEAFGELSARFPLPRRVVGAVAVAYIGKQFSIDPATGEDALLPAEAVIGASLSRTFPLGVNWGGGTFSQLDARLSIDNAGDVAQCDSYGLPEPGRRVRFEIRLQQGTPWFTHAMSMTSRRLSRRRERRATRP